MKAIHIRKLCRKVYKIRNPPRRRALTPDERREIWKKTGGRCHLCGDSIGKCGSGRWQADHVVPHVLSGKQSIDNYLPICRECNGLRWSHGPKLLRLIMRMGVYAKHEIRHGRPLGDAMVELLLRRLGTNRKRRVAS